MKYIGALLIGVVIFSAACNPDEVEPPDALEQFIIDTDLIDIWLTDNAVTDTIIHSDSKIRYSIVELGPGTGVSPRFQEGDTIRVNYEGRILDSGEVFDSATEADLELDKTVPGWQIMLPLMKEGDTFTIYLQSIYGYGPDGNGTTIPSSTNIVFDIKLIRVSN